MEEETYSGLVMNRNVKALYSSKTGEPVVWINPHPKARVVTIQPGHFAESYLNSEFRALVYQSILWAGRR